MGCGLWGIDEVYNLGEEQLNKSFLYNLVTLSPGDDVHNREPLLQISGGLDGGQSGEEYNS